MLAKIKTLAEFAYDNVPLYRILYQGRPELGSMKDFERLPCLTRNDFALCSVGDTLSDADEAIVILPPIENKTLFPFPRLESADDRDCRYEVFYFLLKQAGVIDGSSFLIITDTKHSYYCGEIASNLLYYGHPTWIMLLRDHSADEVQSWIDKFQPDCLLLGLDGIPEEAAHWGVEFLFTINQYGRDLTSQGADSIFHFDIYAVTEIGWIAVRLPGGHYMYSPDYFYMEVDPRDSILTLTALESWLQPFIRYKTSDRGEIMGDNMFRVTYTGEH